MTSVVIQGNTYSDDGTAAKDMRNGGHRTHFFPMVQDVVTTAADVAADAAQVAIDVVTSAASMAGYSATSTTSMLIAVGALAFDFSANKLFHAGDDVVIYRTSDTTKRLYGRLSGYTVGTGATTIDVSAIEGAGTFSDWTMRLSGERGAQGVPAGMTRRAIAGADTVLSSDTGKFLDLSGTTYALAFQPCATLGAGTWFPIRNGASGTVTLTPDGVETIDGSATLELGAGGVVFVHCDGSALRTVYDSRAKLVRLPIFSSRAAALNGASSYESPYNAVNSIGQASISMAADASIFIAGPSGSSANVSSSADGRAWVLRAMPSTKLWVPASSGSGFVAVNTTDTATASSAAGTTWAGATALASTPTSPATSFAAISGRYLVRGSASTTTLYLTVDDGANWTTETAPAANLDSIFSVSGLFFARASTGAYYTSATGTTGSWTLRALPGSCDVVAQDADGSLIARVSGSLVDNFQRTTDGINWTDLGFLPAVNNSLCLLNVGSVYAHGTATETYTRHNSHLVRRNGSFSTPYDANKIVARIGSVTVIVRGSTTSAYVIDPTASDAATALFD